MGNTNITLSPTEFENKEPFIKMPRVLDRCESEGLKIIDVYNLAMLKSLANNFTEMAYISVVSIADLQGINSSKSTNKVNIRESFVRLKDFGYIKVYKDSYATEILDDLESVKFSSKYFVKPTEKNNDNFIKVFNKDLLKIVQMNTSNHKSKIFSTYLNILSPIFYNNTNERYSFESISNIVSNTKINVKSIYNYTQDLFNNELLYFVSIKVEDSLTKNYYCRWIHKDLLLPLATDNARDYWKIGENDINYKIGPLTFEK